MAEYIKLEDAIALFYPVDPENDGSDGCTVVCQTGNYTSGEIEAMLSELPTIDPVHAAGGCYCQECEFWEEQDWSGAYNGSGSLQRGGGCRLYTIGLLATDFCSRGKRKETAHE